MARRWVACTPGGGVLARGLERINARHPWNHNDHFHGWIVANLPNPCRAVLDVGCGRGELLTRLATVAPRVVGCDVDTTMRRLAEQRCAGLGSVSILGGPWAEIEGPFDAVTMIAVLHHLDVERALGDVIDLLVPGGRFLAVGLADPRSLPDHLWDAASILTNPIIGYVKHPSPSRVPPDSTPTPVRDPDLSFDELRGVLHRVMPGSIRCRSPRSPWLNPLWPYPR